MILFNDRSQWNGVYDAENDPNPVVALKMGGGDQGLYFDSLAAVNYRNASTAGKTIISYWFAGGTDPIAEADYFIRAMTPLAEDDVLALDWEVNHSNPVDWCTQFVNHVHDVLGVWPLVYMNMSTANAYDWSPVFNNCGYWCAAPSFSFDDELPVKYPQVAQQGPIVNGLDTDAFFGTLDQLKQYGYHGSHVSTPAPVPTEPPVASVPAPVPEPIPPVTPETTPPVAGDQPSTPTTGGSDTTAPPATDSTKPPKKLSLFELVVQFIKQLLASFYK